MRVEGKLTHREFQDQMGDVKTITQVNAHSVIILENAPSQTGYSNQPSTGYGR